jgi:hypothetical protein
MDDSWMEPEPEPEDDFRSAPEPLARTSSAQLAQMERAKRERVEAAVRATKADTAIDAAELRHALDSIQSFKNRNEFATAQDDERTCARPRLLPFPGARASSSFS